MALENAVVFGSLLLSAIVVVARVRSIPGLKMSKKVSLPKWEFSKSWASTFTVFAAVISALTSSAKTVLPDPPQYLSVSGYVTLAIAFGLLVTLPPFLYRAMSTPRGDGPEPEYDGAVWSFSVCTALALWATLGQLATVTLFLLETQPGTVAQPTGIVLVAPFAIVGIALVSHVFRAMKAILEVPPGERTDAPRPIWDLF